MVLLNRRAAYNIRLSNYSYRISLPSCHADAPFIRETSLGINMLRRSWHARIATALYFVD